MTFVPEGGQLEQFLDICLKNHYQTSSSHVGVQWVNRESRRIWQNCTVHTGGALVNWLNCSSRCLPELQFSSSRCSARRPGKLWCKFFLQTCQAMTQQQPPNIRPRHWTGQP